MRIDETYEFIYQQPCHRCGRIDGLHGDACRETTKTDHHPNATMLYTAMTDAWDKKKGYRETTKDVQSSQLPLLPAESAARKTFPVATGVLDYFPDAMTAIAHVSYVGNEQHNPGQPMHWAREKSTDQADTLMRHFLERGKLDVDGLRHTAKMAWRALALLQLEIEGEID